jgi:uncharacterized protein involved in response to NO
MSNAPNVPVAFLQGFRPFFLGATAWAPVSLALWIAAIAGGVSLPTALPLAAWHPHELLFGYAGAVVAGFLLTAVPNWTSRQPIRGRPLMAIWSLWLAARLVGLVGAAIAPLAPVVLDVAFWGVLATTIGREIALGRNWRNLPVVGLLSLLGIACLLSQLEALGFGSGPTGRRLGLTALLMLIGLIGGRVVPSFTHNWLAKRGSGCLPAAFDRIDAGALALLAIAATTWVLRPEDGITGAMLIVSGLSTIIRLSRWRGAATLTEPLVAILHMGYLWLGVGLILLGAGLLLPDSIGRLAALHALTAGAVGTMTIAIMTRATLGHTGRQLTADRATVVIYFLLQAGAALRAVAPVLPIAYDAAITAAAVLWGTAFLLFVAHYGPMLVGPRVSDAG